MNIGENTKCKHGSIIVSGRKRLYFMAINPLTNSDSTVQLVIYNSMGTVVDSMERTYCRIKNAFMTDVVKAALVEYKHFNAE